MIETVDMRTDMWADTIENQVTIRDPVQFTGDWHFMRQYVRVNSEEWPDDPQLCGGPEGRNPVIDGCLTVQRPPEP